MISVVIPDCKDGIYFQRCINSIRRQTYRDIEIIAVCKDENTKIDADDVRSIVVEGNIKDIVIAALNIACGTYIVFLGYNCVMAPNLIEELVRSDELSQVSFYKANEVLVSGDHGVRGNDSIYELVGMLFKKEHLRRAIDQAALTTYCDGLVILENYLKEFADSINYVNVYYYITEVEDQRMYKVPYDNECYKNTLRILGSLSEIERTETEKFLTEDVNVPDDKRQEVCNLICNLASDSYRLMMDCVVKYYSPLYKNACLMQDEDAYERVKKFLIEINDLDLLDVALKKLGISFDMFSTMKRLDFHNYQFVVEDNSLFISMKYPDGIASLTGPELADFVISRFAEGRLGARTIVKSLWAWMKNKFSRG